MSNPFPFYGKPFPLVLSHSHCRDNSLVLQSWSSSFACTVLESQAWQMQRLLLDALL